MNRLTQHRSFVIAGGLLTILTALALPIAARAAEDVQNKLIVGPNDEIYGTKEAADLAAEARKFDVEVLPTLMVVGSDGQVISRREGFHSAEALLAWLKPLAAGAATAHPAASASTFSPSSAGGPIP